MALKKHISYKWRLFIPSVVCLWIVIFVMFYWQAQTVSGVRDEMAYDQLDVVGARIVSHFEQGNIDEIPDFATWASKFFDEAEAYDPLTIVVKSVDDKGREKEDIHYGPAISKEYKLPIAKRGTITVPGEYVDNEDHSDQKFIYSIYTSSDYRHKVYVLLPYTKRLINNIDDRETFFWLIFAAIALFVTILLYISISYFGRNIHMLKVFSHEASKNPNFVPPQDIEFSNDELGDISRQILEIYNQRMEELLQREKEHAVALSAVEDKNRMKRELTSNINHELKTPVGVIQGYIDTLVSDPAMDPETRDKFLLKTQEGVQRLVDIIRDITEITKLDSGGKLVNLTVFNMHDLVFSFDNMLQDGNVLQGKDTKMTFKYDIPLQCKVYGNESLLQTVLLNFVKNAVAYSGGTECHFNQVGETENTVSFKFYDNGNGVAPESLPHMFERFYRINSGRSRAAGGTGLGLAIVEVTIKSFGGTIDVMNHFPSGLEFNFTLFKSKPKNPEDTVEDYLT